MSNTPKRVSSFFRSSRSSTPAPTTPEGPDQAAKQLDQVSIQSSGGEGDDTGDFVGGADLFQGETETEAGKFKALLGILRKTISVKDLASVRISLPATMMEGIGNLEAWTYLDRPDYFAAIGEEDGELERFLGVLRWMFTKELKFSKHSIAKPFNSILGEHFHCYYDTPILSLHPTSGAPAPTVNLDESPTSEVITNAGRGSSSNSTSSAALKGSPSLSSISAAQPKPALANGKSEAIASSSASTRSASTSASFSTAPAQPRSARIVLLNEQTSHHPPISHFLVEARVANAEGQVERTVRLRGADQLSAKFTGANVKIQPGASNKGLFVEVEGSGEEYQITHPTAAVAGLLRASPYATICDTTLVSVSPLDPAERQQELDLPEEERKKKKRLRAIVAYQEESWITRPRFIVEGVVYESYPNEAASCSDSTGGDDKRYTKIKQVPSDRIVGKLNGNWRGEVKWTKAGESTSSTLVDLLPLSVFPKTVAPLSEQDELETRRVWLPVCEALQKKEFSNASKEKQRIEQVQRDKAEVRKKNGEIYRPLYFEAEPEDPTTWDGRPRLTAAGKAALERDFKADYTTGEAE
ncbi:hypothetical protein JCM11641_007874 [Rhodosporidiobolus odoratus]